MILIEVNFIINIIVIIYMVTEINFPLPSIIIIVYSHAHFVLPPYQNLTGDNLYKELFVRNY